MEYEVARLHLMGFSDLCLTIEEIQGYLMWVGCLYDGDTVRHNIADIYLCDLCRDFLEKTIPEELRAALFSMLTALGTADDD